MALKSLSKVLVFVNNYHISRRGHSLFYGQAQWVVILMQTFLASSIPQWGHGYIFTKYIFPSVTIMSWASVMTETFEMFLILRDFSGTKLLRDSTTRIVDIAISTVTNLNVACFLFPMMFVSRFATCLVSFRH